MAAASTPRMRQNNLLTLASQDQLCKAFGVKITTDVTIVSIAVNAGYDSLFVDLEHTTLSLRDASQLCITALASGIPPFVRVPYQCGRGFVQRVLDMGAMGVIFPHIHSVEDAKAAVAMCKFPPQGGRSLTVGLPHFGHGAVSPDVAMKELDEKGSTVFIMIETKDALAAVYEIAAVPGVEVLLVGSNDLGQELGCLGQWDGEVFLGALRRVSEACRKHGKIFAIAGLYHRPDLMEGVVNDMGARWVLGGLDAGLLVGATKQNCDVLAKLQR